MAQSGVHGEQGRTRAKTWRQPADKDSNDENHAGMIAKPTLHLEWDQNRASASRTGADEVLARDNRTGKEIYILHQRIEAAEREER